MGVVCGSLAVSRVWSSDQSSLHINFLVLETVYPCLEKIPEVALWKSCPDSDGLHYGDALSEEGRRDQVQVLGLEGKGDYSERLFI